MTRKIRSSARAARISTCFSVYNAQRLRFRCQAEAGFSPSPFRCRPYALVTIAISLQSSTRNATMTRVRANFIWGREPQGAKLGAKPEAKIDELFDRNARRDQLGLVPEHTLAFLEGLPLKPHGLLPTSVLPPMARPRTKSRCCNPAPGAVGPASKLRAMGSVRNEYR